MLVGSFTSTILWCLENPIWMGLSFLCTAVLLLARAPLRRFWRQRRSNLTWVGLIILLLGLLDIIFLDLPASQLKNVLRSDLRYRPDPGLKNPVRDSGETLWRSMVCSRISGAAFREKLNTYGLACSDSEEEYRRISRDKYLANAALCVILILSNATLLVRYWELGSAPATLETRSPSKPSLIVIVALSSVDLVNLLLLPWAYGKLQEPTVLKEAIVRMDNGEDKIVAAHGFILSEDDSTVVLFHKVERQPWFIPKERVYLVRVERHNDVIKDYYSRLLNTSAKIPGAPL